MERFQREATAFFRNLYEEERKVLVFGEGRVGASVMMIGEAPGEQESLQGRPFVGKAGKNLDAFLAQAGMDRASLYVTNVVKFRPTRRSEAGRTVNRPPTQEAVPALAAAGDRLGGPGIYHHPGQRAPEGAYRAGERHRRHARQVHRLAGAAVVSNVSPRVGDLQSRFEGGIQQ